MAILNSSILIQKQSLFDELGINSILNTRTNDNFLHKMKRTDKSLLPPSYAGLPLKSIESRKVQPCSTNLDQFLTLPPWIEKLERDKK